MPLEPCPTCRRHRRVDDAPCPFCRSTSPVRAALLAAALGLTGCPPPSPPAPVYGGPPDIAPVQTTPPPPAPEPAPAPDPGPPPDAGVPVPAYGAPPEPLPPAYGAPPPR